MGVPYVFQRGYQLLKPLALVAFLSGAGCTNIITREEYEAAKKRDAEQISTLRAELAGAKERYEKANQDITDLVTKNTSIDALIPKIAEAKEEILKKNEGDYGLLNENWKKTKEELEKSRRETVARVTEQERWFGGVAKPAIGKPADADGPAEGIYADRTQLERHETRLTNQKDAFHKLEESLAYQRKVEEWSYTLSLEYRLAVEKKMEYVQGKLDALDSAPPDKRAEALVAVDREIKDFEKNLSELYLLQKEKRKHVPPRDEEKK